MGKVNSEAAKMAPQMALLRLLAAQQVVVVDVASGVAATYATAGDYKFTQSDSESKGECEMLWNRQAGKLR